MSNLKPEYVFAGIAGVAIVIAIYVFWNQSKQAAAPPAVVAPPMMNMGMTGPFSGRRLQQPPAIPAAKTQLDDSAEVFGVAAGDKHRAYVVSIFKGSIGLIINDLLGDVPVTITYAQRKDRCRVFTSQVPGAALKIDLHGMWDGEPMLQVPKVFYMLESGKVAPHSEPWPYTELPVERTTWKAWKTAHPDTDLSTGWTSPSSAGAAKPSP